jgi:Lon protease-like protein
LTGDATYGRPAPRLLPMFPLGTVLFPYAELPLHVFEPRYRVMVHDLLAGDREFGVVLIERGHEVGGGDTRFDVGTLASLVRAAELPDGRFALRAVGLGRIRVVEWLADDPYPRARVVELAEATPTGDVAGAHRAVAAGFEALAAAIHARRPSVPPYTVELAPDPVRASYEGGALAPITPLDAQRLLEVDDVAARLRLLARLLRDQVAVIEALGPAAE